MPVQYDPMLVTLSIAVAIMGSFTGLILTSGTRWSSDCSPKFRILKGAIAVGGCIWSMHFIGMLALKLPVIVNYNVLQTVISAFTAMLVTGLGLYICNYKSASMAGLLIGGVFMGSGIAAMHYIGMSALRGSCTVSYSVLGVVVSILIAIGVSTGALWVAFRQKALREIAVAAVILGLSMSSMHYAAMFSTSFLQGPEVTYIAAPVFTSDIIAIAVALTSFFFCGLFLLMALPDMADADALKSVDGQDLRMHEGDGNPVKGEAALKRIPVQKNGATVFLPPANVFSVSADGHYSIIRDAVEEYYCDLSISKIEDALQPVGIMRCHRSFLVNIHHVKAMSRDGDRGFLIMKGHEDHKIPVSRSKLEMIRRQLEDGLDAEASDLSVQGI